MDGWSLFVFFKSVFFRYFVLNFFLSSRIGTPWALVSPHKILNFESKSTETHTPQSGKHWPAGLQQTGQNSALYRQLPHRILNLAS